MFIQFLPSYVVERVALRVRRWNVSRRRSAHHLNHARNVALDDDNPIPTAAVHHRMYDSAIGM
jgi:hypothetical protein